MVPQKQIAAPGIEPGRTIGPADFKSAVSTYSTTLPRLLLD